MTAAPRVPDTAHWTVDDVAPAPATYRVMAQVSKGVPRASGGEPLRGMATTVEEVCSPRERG